MKGGLDALLMTSKPKEAEGGDESLSAAKDVMSAFKNSDPKGLNLALKRHYEACQSEHTEEEDDDEEEY